VDQLQWFYRSTEDWSAMTEQLKLTHCPHCKTVGTLILHGFLYGFDDTIPHRQTVRARRIFCSNRNARPGCGHTVSVWIADKIRRLSLTAHTLWSFLQRAVASSIATAIRAANCQRSDRTWRRIWKRFHLSQSRIRTTLSTHCRPPDLPAELTRRPESQVLAHLEAVFPNNNCPIATFQYVTHTFFL
jgi:hypothetical protein